MSRLLVHVEGQTEEEFVNEVLRDHLLAMGYSTVSARIVGNSRQRDRRGGIKPWPSVKKDIVNHLREDTGCIATTMVDYYGLPGSGEKAWPGRADATHLSGEKKATSVETALLADIDAELRGRFVPFVVLHEFEALLFSDCAEFSRAIGLPAVEAGLKTIRDQFPTPEDINDSPSPPLRSACWPWCRRTTSLSWDRWPRSQSASTAFAASARISTDGSRNWNRASPNSRCKPRSPLLHSRNEFSDTTDTPLGRSGRGCALRLAAGRADQS